MNAPDLYIPLMGFLTYILIVSYGKGKSNKYVILHPLPLSPRCLFIHTTHAFRFSPDVIGEVATYCVVMQLVEIGIMSACLYLLNSSVSFLDLVSFSGYKYVCLVINAIVLQLLGDVGYYVSLLYTGVAVSFFTVRPSVLRLTGYPKRNVPNSLAFIRTQQLKCLKGSVAEPSPESRAFRNYMLFGYVFTLCFSSPPSKLLT